MTKLSACCLPSSDWVVNLRHSAAASRRVNRFRQQPCHPQGLHNQLGCVLRHMSSSDGRQPALCGTLILEDVFLFVV